ncbi:MAG: sensor histidine kinase [Acidimicrobiales bacterium]
MAPAVGRAPPERPDRARRSWRRLPRRSAPHRSLSLRSRLLGTLLLVVAIGLVVADVATWEALRSFETQRVDQQLAAAQNLVADQVRHGFSLDPGVGAADELLPFGTYWTIVGPDARPVLSWVPLGRASQPSSGPTVAPPQVPASFVKRLDAAGAGTTQFLTVRSGHTVDRLIAEVATDSPDLLVVSTPLTSLIATLGRLALIEALVSASVVVIGMAVAVWLVRLGLRPLDDMVRTADGIAAGDLARRVGRADTTTEVGRLGTALNAMLERIEASFAAQQASEGRLRRFVADASHELRTPLTSIRGYAELFRRGAADRPQDLALAMRRIESEASRMGVLVDDLLLLARLDQGRPLDRETVDLTALVTDAVSDFRAVDPGRPVSLDAPAPILVEGDEVRLRQVVGNLLTNARVHTPPGTTVRAGVSVEGETALLEVADDGPGLAPEQAERVFERFYRADTSRHHGDASGSGLGLSIVAAVVRAHGGEAAVSSAPGRGATFSIRLPLRPGDGGTHPEEERAEGRADGGEGSPGQGDDRAATGSQSAGRQA